MKQDFCWWQSTLRSRSIETARRERSELDQLQKHYSRSTPREEREVLPFVVAGFANKQTASDLGTSKITIGVHRGQIMRKLGARSLAELVRMADRLGIQPPGPVKINI
ncbi:MAG: LuxR C-terminal-related transcriptional regulator [Paludibaculum sp.]